MVIKSVIIYFTYFYKLKFDAFQFVQKKNELIFTRHLHKYSSHIVFPFNFGTFYFDKYYVKLLILFKFNVETIL